MLKAVQLLLAVSLAVGGVIAAGAAEDRPVLAAGALPECRYDDVLTRHRDTSDWRISLLDTIYKLPRGYVPPRLVSTANAGLNGKHKVRPKLIDDLRALARAARNAGAAIRITSGYRSYREQKALYRAEVRRFGVEVARTQVARPGHSEHQLGTTIDVGSASSTKSAWKYDDWAAQTAAGAWMRDNAWRYGFVMTYPKGKKSVTCYMYEPWHYRYVGRGMAAEVRASGLTLREYLWREYH